MSETVSDPTTVASEDGVVAREEGAGGASATKKRSAGPPIDPRLVRRARATRVYMIAGVGVGSATAVLILCQAKLLSSSIADVFATRSVASLGLVVALLAGVLLARGALAWASSWLAQRTAAAVKSQLRRDILAARLASPANQTTTSSSLVTLVTQGLDALDGYFSKYLPQLLLAVTVPLIVGAAILFSDWRSALIIAATIPFIPVLMALVGYHTEAQVKKRWDFQSRLSSHFADLVAGLPTLQVFGRARAQAEGLRRTEGANRRETMGILRISFLSAFVLELFSTIAVAVVALVIGTRLVYDQMGFSTALFVLILAPEVYLPIRQVGVHYHDSADGLAAAEAAFAEIDRAGMPADSVRSSVAAPVDSVQSGSDSRRALPPSIHVRGVTYTYPGSDTMIGPCDLDVAPGEIVALAGRSGGGKTTLLNVILGFLKPSDGDVNLGGFPLSELDREAWRAGLAYVPQVPGMVSGTIGDNVRLGWDRATDEQVRRMLDEAGATTLDLQRNVGEEGEGLSVGERRRVGIARALARIELGGARMLILDEPTAGLDADTEARVLTSLKASGATALVVSHREAVMEAADRIVTVGQVVGLGAGPSLRSTAAQEGPVTNSGTDVAVHPSARGVHTDPVDGSDEGMNQSSASANADRVTMQPSATPSQGFHLVSLVMSLFRDVPEATNDSSTKSWTSTHTVWLLVAAILLAAAASGAAVALMGVSAWLISKAAQHPPFLELSVAAVGVRFFGISRGVFRYVERLVGHEVALRMQSALRIKTYVSLARTTLLGRRQGDLLVRVVSDVSAIEDVVVRIIQPFIAAALVVVGVVAILGAFSPPAALAILASAILGGIVVPWLTARSSLRSDRQAVPLRGELGAQVHDLARTAPDLAAYGATKRALAAMSAVDLRLRRTEERAAFAQGIGNGLQTIAAGLGVIGGLWIGAQAVASGALGPRMLAVMVLTPLALHEVFANFTQAAQTMTRAKVALGRVMAILDAPAIGRGDVEQRPAGEEPSIVCDNVAIGWPGHPVIASGISVDVRPGEAVGVMGRSGVGKTTLAATVMGLIPPVEGQLSTSGRIGYLAQDAHIFATSVAENVRIGNKDATDAEVEAALAEAGLSMDPARQVGEMGSTLSGGEARRLALARLFVGDYRLLILDEPTEHLDRETADALMDDVFATEKTRPLLVISHDESVAARCSTVLRMDEPATAAVASADKRGSHMPHVT